ncbi:hypothetical protein GMMP15_1030060 [Candidatus Magnetomoraceae bacterium gMMP-15]
MEFFSHTGIMEIFIKTRAEEFLQVISSLKYHEKKFMLKNQDKTM